MKIPNITDCTYQTFTTPKGRFMEVFYGDILEVFYHTHSIMRAVPYGWKTDDDILKGLNNLLHPQSKQ